MERRMVRLWTVATAQSSGGVSRGEARRCELWWCSGGCGGGAATGSWRRRGCGVVAAARPRAARLRCDNGAAAAREDNGVAAAREEDE
jgi:hypothetical protein